MWDGLQHFTTETGLRWQNSFVLYIWAEGHFSVWATNQKQISEFEFEF